MAHEMEQVKISPKFQVAIPKAVRESLRPTAGQRLQIVLYGDRIELVPVRKIGEMRDSSPAWTPVSSGSRTVRRESR